MPQRIQFLIYGYTPSLAWNATLLAFFAASALVHTVQATRTRYWIFFPTLILGAVVEVMGYAARVWSSQDVYVLTSYLMQICLLIMAPVFFSAFLYVMLGVAIRRLGQQYSVLTPKMYLITFIIADLVSLILQAVGGGQAASGAARSAPTQTATNIMVAGIIFQLIAMGIFMSCGIDFALRYASDRPYAFRLRQIAAQRAKAGEVGEGDLALESTGSPAVQGDAEKDTAGKKELIRKWRIVMAGILISSTMILLRGIFRSIELWEGWRGFLVTHEIYQAVLDGIPMVIAVGIFNIIHPGMILGRKATWSGYY